MTLIERAESVLEWGTSYDMATVLIAELAAEVNRLTGEHNPYCPESGRIVDPEYGVSDDEWAGKATVYCKGCDEAMSATRIQGSNDYMIPRHKW